MNRIRMVLRSEGNLQDFVEISLSAVPDDIVGWVVDMLRKDLENPDGRLEKIELGETRHMVTSWSRDNDHS